MPKKRKIKRGLYTKYFRWFSDLIGYERVVLWVRVSGREQKRRKNLDEQEAVLRQAVERCGVEVVGVFRHVGPGRNLDDRLPAAIGFARKHNAVLLAESLDRFLRHPEFRADTNPDAMPTEAQLEDLKRIADGVLLVTLLKPEAEPHEVRGHQRKRGQAAKGNRGGGDRMLGYKKRRRKQKHPEVKRLYVQGKSIREIAKLTGIPSSTIGRWLKPES